MCMPTSRQKCEKLHPSNSKKRKMLKVPRGTPFSEQRASQQAAQIFQLPELGEPSIIWSTIATNEKNAYLCDLKDPGSCTMAAGRVAVSKTAGALA